MALRSFSAHVVGWSWCNAPLRHRASGLAGARRGALPRASHVSRVPFNFKIKEVAQGSKTKTPKELIGFGVWFAAR